MSPDFEMLMRHLRERTADVELDLPAPQASPDPATAAKLARSQRAVINRGDRIAKVHKLVNGARQANGARSVPDLEAVVTETEARGLVAGGARWVGPASEAPSAQPYIDRLRVVNFRCVNDVTIPLTPLHAFIGPNDSGKTTLLDAIFGIANDHSEPNAVVTASYQQNAATLLRNSGVRPPRFVHPTGIDPEEALRRNHVLGPPENSALLALSASIRLLRLDPDAMREPTHLIPQGAAIDYDQRGRGLPAVYDGLLSRRLEAFVAINREFTQLFPTARAIQLTNPTQTTKALSVELTNGQTIDAGKLSEGMLYWLAFAALPYLAPTGVVLVEEPENGLHPARIAEVMRVLRTISRSTQVIIATHSPLVINELQADEVTLITRTPERGTIATPLSATKNFAQRSKVYALGELWLNYADGDFESELVAESTLPES